VEYATQVSISVALCLLRPEMFSMNIFFRHLVVVTTQLKSNISSPSKLWRQIGKCRYSPTHYQPQHYMEVRGQLQSLQMEPQFQLNGKLGGLCHSKHFWEDISLLPTAGNRTTIPVIQPFVYSPYRLGYPISLRSIH